MSLTYKDVAEILRIVDESDVEELILELADSKLVIRRHAAPGGAAIEKPAAVTQTAPAPATTAPEPTPKPVATPAASAVRNPS